MAYGKDIFRTKYREANEGLKTAQNNYLELDHEYQMLAKRVEKAIEYTNKFINFKTSRIDEWKNVELVLETIVQLLQGEDKDE